MEAERRYRFKAGIPGCVHESVLESREVLLIQNGPQSSAWKPVRVSARPKPRGILGGDAGLQWHCTREPQQRSRLKSGAKSALLGPVLSLLTDS